MPRPILKKRMSVLKEHKTLLLENRRNPEFKQKLEFDNPNYALCSKSLFIGKVYFKENGKTKPKTVVIKELDLDRSTYRVATGNAPTVIQEIKDYIIIKKLKATPKTITEFYNKTIIELRKAGIPLPKMMAVTRDEKVLIISQYFGNKRLRKLTKNNLELFLLGPDKEKLIELYARIINKGFIPTLDLIEIMKTKEGKLEPIPIDIDQQVMYYLKYGKINKIKNNGMQILIAKDISRSFFRNLCLMLHENKAKEIRGIMKSILTKINIDYLKENLIPMMKKDILLRDYLQKEK